MYAKVYASMWDGTLYGQWEAWSVFVFLLAHADPEGFVDMTPQAIAGRSGLPLEAVTKGLAVLEEPDSMSRSTELEGRRLERIDAHRPWGWRIVNYLHYRTLQDADTVRQQTRERVRKHRALRNAASRMVTDGNASKRQAEVEVEVSTEIASQSLVTETPGDLSVREWFERYFWPDYPRKRGVSKPKALQALEAAFRNTPKARHGDLGDEIASGLVAYVRDCEGKESQHIAHPATWINQRRWETAHEPA